MIGHACNCVGPQNGQPMCPCRMKFVQVRDGRYVLPEQDLGPAPGTEASRSETSLRRILEYAATLPDRAPKPFPHDEPKEPK